MRELTVVNSLGRAIPLHTDTKLLSWTRSRSLVDENADPATQASALEECVRLADGHYCVDVVKETPRKCSLAEPRAVRTGQFHIVESVARPTLIRKQRLFDRIQRQPLQYQVSYWPQARRHSARTQSRRRSSQRSMYNFRRVGADFSYGTNIFFPAERGGYAI
jgi:hypothetical protein